MFKCRRLYMYMYSMKALEYLLQMLVTNAVVVILYEERLMNSK